MVHYEYVVTKLFTENQTSKIVIRLCYFFCEIVWKLFFLRMQLVFSAVKGNDRAIWIESTIAVLYMHDFLYYIFVIRRRQMGQTLFAVSCIGAIDSRRIASPCWENKLN